MVMQYQDGTIVTFTMGPADECAKRCVWGDEPFDPNKPPTVKQGKVPAGGKTPVSMNVQNGVALPGLPFALLPGITTITYKIPSVTVIQDGASSGGGGGC